jgi:hypothetical protein
MAVFQTRGRAHAHDAGQCAETQSRYYKTTFLEIAYFAYDKELKHFCTRKLGAWLIFHSQIWHDAVRFKITVGDLIQLLHLSSHSMCSNFHPSAIRMMCDQGKEVTVHGIGAANLSRCDLHSSCEVHHLFQCVHLWTTDRVVTRLVELGCDFQHTANHCRVRFVDSCSMCFAVCWRIGGSKGAVSLVLEEGISNFQRRRGRGSR